MPTLYASAIDQGTTGTRFMLSPLWQGCGSAYEEHRQIYPQPGWVEHDAVEIWEKTARPWVPRWPRLVYAPRISPALESPINARRPWSGIAKPGAPFLQRYCLARHPDADHLPAPIDQGKAVVIREKTGLPIATIFQRPRFKALGKCDGLRL